MKMMPDFAHNLAVIGFSLILIIWLLWGAALAYICVGQYRRYKSWFGEQQ